MVTVSDSTYRAGERSQRFVVVTASPASSRFVSIRDPNNDPRGTYMDVGVIEVVFICGP